MNEIEIIKIRLNELEKLRVDLQKKYEMESYALEAVIKTLEGLLAELTAPKPE